MILSWIMSILAVVVLSVVADLLLSGKRMGKFVRGVFASLAVIVIVSPLPDILSGGFRQSGDFLNNAFVADVNYVDYSNALKVNSLERAVEDKLKQDGYCNVMIKIGGNFTSEIKIEFVSVNLSNLVMDEKVAHINKYDALTQMVSEYLGVDKGVVMVYE